MSHVLPQKKQCTLKSKSCSERRRLLVHGLDGEGSEGVVFLLHCDWLIWNDDVYVDTQSRWQLIVRLGFDCICSSSSRCSLSFRILLDSIIVLILSGPALDIGVFTLHLKKQSAIA